MITVMTTLVAIVIVGYVAGKLGYLGGDFDRRLSSVVINITCPALILSSAMTGTLPDRQYILPLLLISIVTYAILTAVAIWLPRLLTHKKADEGVIGFALMFGNVGFMGYPVVAAIFGHEAVFYAAVLNVVNTFAVFTVGTILITGKNEVEGRHFQKKVLYSSPMISAYLTMLIVALEIDNIPEVVSQPLTMILRTMLGNSSVYATTLMRLAVIPLAMYYLCGALGFSDLVVKINTVVIAMPVATYGTILCLRHEKDATLMTTITFITTLFSMLTIPLLVLFFL